MMKKSYDEDDLKRIAGMFSEQLNSKIDLVLEALESMAPVPQKVDKLSKELAEAKSDIKVIKAAVTDTNKDLHHLEKRVSRLKAV